MTNSKQVRLSLERARIILDEARNLQKKGVYNLVVRRAQEAVELALKGALQWVGLDIPRIHDVGGILRQHSERFPSNFQVSIPKLASISRVLRAEREISFYGDEDSGLPPEMLYDAADAEEALSKAVFVLERCGELLTL